MSSMPLSRYSLTSLQLFSAVAHARSLTQAATDFGLALSAASRRISDMESVAGTQLFHRSKNGVSLTAAGRVLLKHADGMTAAVDAMAADMKDFSFGVEDRVRLWANTSAINGFLPSILEEFLLKHPHIQIDLEEALSIEIVSAVRSGQADLGVVSGNTYSQGLDAEICDTHALAVLLPPGHVLLRKKSLFFEEILPFDLVALNKGSALLDLLDDQAKLLRKSLRIRVQVRSFDAICRLVASRLGVSILPQPAVGSIAQSLGLRSRPLRMLGLYGICA
ncbi:MAG: LysR family transcriptional regulator [Brachymonas sp.]|nr:LysR family transcriptional regulator [Brachymonas sp.]